MNPIIDEIVAQPELHPDLDWMLQSQQVTDEQVMAILVNEYYEPLYAFARALLTDGQPAFNTVLDALSRALHDRRRYWGGLTVRAWLYRFAWQSLRRKAGRAWSRRALRVLLCGHLGLEAPEAAAVLGETGDGAAERLAHDRQHLRPADHELVQTAYNWIAAPVPANRPDADGIRRLVLEAANQTGRQRRLFFSFRQFLLLGLLLAGVLGATLYRMVVDLNTPIQATVQVIYVTATPFPPTETPMPTFTPQPTSTVVGRDGLPLSVVYPLNTDLTTLDAAHLTPERSGPLDLYLAMKYVSGTASTTIFQTLQPNPADPTVMFYELVDYASEAGFASELRLGATTLTLRRLLNAGYLPVLQVGYLDAEKQWRSMYVILTGYDNDRRIFYLPTPNLPFGEPAPEPYANLWAVDYSDLSERGVAFANAYLVIYPAAGGLPSRLMEALEYQSLEDNYIKALNLLLVKSDGALGRDMILIEFGIATVHAYRQDYTSANVSFTTARARMINNLSPAAAPFRLYWYNTRPYWAAYYTGNYQQLADLAGEVISRAEESGVPVEESYYWRALAYQALGDTAAAIKDLEKALELNPNFYVARTQLEQIQGAKP